MMMGINKLLKRRLSRFRKSDEGVTAIEFAFVIGPFLFLLLSTFEMGIMLFFEYAIAQNVETASRLIRTGQMQMNLNGHSNTAGYFKSQICGNLSAYIDCQQKLHVDVRKHALFQDIQNDLPDSGDPNNYNQYDPGSAGEIVTVRVSYEYKLLIPNVADLLRIGSQESLGSNGVRLLTSAATFRNEPFSNGS